MSQPFKFPASKPVADAPVQQPWSFTPRAGAWAAVLCFCLGLFVVGWRASHRAEAERSLAQDRARIQAARLKAGLSHALSAAEALAVHVRQSGGRLAGFQKIAAEMLPSYPGLVSLELLPGGVITEVAPQTGNERSIGYSIMRDPAAGVAIKLRRMAVSGPLLLANGRAGVIGRFPVFLSDINGREFFWGFASASVALSDLIAEAKLDELAAQGYRYLLYANPAPPLKPVTIVNQGNPVLAKAIQQPVTVANLDFSLAVVKRGGWGRFTPMLFEILVLLGIIVIGTLYGQAHFQLKQDQAKLAVCSTRLAQEQERAGQLETQLQTAAETGAAERDSAKASAESLRGHLSDLENQLHLSQERGGQLEKELRLAKETGAVVLGSARKTAETLQARLREIELQLAQEKEEGSRLRMELQGLRERLEKGSAEVHQAKEAVLARWKEAEAELQRARERLAQMEEELRFQAQRLAEAEEQGKQLPSLKDQLHRMQEEHTAELKAAQDRVESLGNQLKHAEAELHASRQQLAQLTQEMLHAKAKPEDESQSQESPSATLAAPDSEPLSDTSSLASAAPGNKVEQPNTNSSTPPLPEIETAEIIVSDVEVNDPNSPPMPDLVNDSELTSIMDHSPDPVEEMLQEPAVATEPEKEIEATAPEPRKSEKTVSRKRHKDRGQLDLFGEPAMPADVSLPPQEPHRESSPETVPQRKSPPSPTVEKPKTPASIPLNKTAFKKHATELYTLLAESDPGAQDCLADTREDLRPAFSPESFSEFEHHISTLDCPEALQLLLKTARRHGINLQ